MRRFLLHIVPLIYLGFITLGIVFGLYIGSDAILDNSTKEEVWWSTLLRSLYMICIVHVIPCFIGFLIPHRQLKNRIEDIQKEIELPSIYVRYVTRGDKPDIILNSVLHSLDMLAPYANTYVEVVSDVPVILNQEAIQNLNPSNLLEYVVPVDYRTEINTRYKARALQYALEKSPAKPDDYILHLDEESRLTSSVILGIYQHIYQNPDKIGQGIITYRRSIFDNGGQNICSPLNWKRFFFTMSDAIRISDDLSRFRLSFIIGYPVFGCKGSFILLKNQIERALTLAMPPSLCITEDASFAFNAYQNKYKFAFVEGMIEEASPSYFIDFIKQRSRWMRGLWSLVRHHPCSVWKKIIITVSLASWTLIGLNIVSTVAIFVLYQYKIPTSIAVINGIILFNYVFSYFYPPIIGGYIKWPTWKLILSPIILPLYLILTTILMPFHLIIETISVIYAMMTITYQGFDLISKC